MRKPSPPPVRCDACCFARILETPIRVVFWGHEICLRCFRALEQLPGIDSQEMAERALAFQRDRFAKIFRHWVAQERRKRLRVVR
jgi:hypothetical protein